MPESDHILDRLAKSRFRARFRLGRSEQKYLSDKGLETVMGHARSFILARLAPARPAKDGSQTPTKGHPVFIAQHATATCCRSCLCKWHGMEKDVELTDKQVAQILQLIEAWILRQGVPHAPPPSEPTLFDHDPQA